MAPAVAETDTRREFRKKTVVVPGGAETVAVRAGRLALMRALVGSVRIALTP
ncbi:MAG: hypothetical protein ACRD1D_14405 [Acidimicrobiales bacterium]